MHSRRINLDQVLFREHESLLTLSVSELMGTPEATANKPSMLYYSPIHAAITICSFKHMSTTKNLFFLMIHYIQQILTGQFKTKLFGCLLVYISYW